MKYKLEAIICYIFVFIAGRNYCTGNSKTAFTNLRKTEIEKYYQAKTKSIDGFIK